MAYRIVRSPERRVFYIDVGNIPPQDVEQFMARVSTQMKKNQLVDAKTGRVDLRYNPLSIDEDYFIPVRGGNNSRIESLPGGTYTGDIDDVKYLRDKLFSALKVPMSYLSRGDGASEDKATLAQKDIRFARTIQRLQRSVISELVKMGIIHLYTIGYRGDDLLSFKLTLNNPSKIAELQELEHWKTKFDIAGSATEGYFSKRWISDNIFGMSDEQFLRNQREMFYDKRYASSLEKAVEEEAAAEAATAGGMDLGGAGMDLGGEPGAETPPGEEATPEAGADAATAGGDTDTALLTAPANRDKNTVQAYKHGKKNGKRKVKSYKNAEAKRSGRTRNEKSNGGISMAGKDSFFPGNRDLAAASNGVYQENKHGNIYDKEETKLFKVNNDIKALLESLELKKDET